MLCNSQGSGLKDEGPALMLLCFIRVVVKMVVPFLGSLL